MPDLSQTAGNVRGPASVSNLATILAGESITAGAPLYKKSADNRAWLTDADAGADEAACIGVAITNADAGESVTYAKGDGAQINLGATLTVGETYVCSNTAGKVAPIGDVASGWYVTVLGTASTAALLDLAIQATGIARA